MSPSFTAFVDEMRKIAEEKTPEQKKHNPWLDTAKVIGTGLLGFGAGTAVGFGGTHLINKLLNKSTGNKGPNPWLLKALPYLVGASGMAYGIGKSVEQEKIRRAFAHSPDAAHHPNGSN